MAAPTGEPAIELAGVGKRYGAVTALRDVSLTVAPGELLAVLGPNGAGKTTTVEILEGYRRADVGRVRVLGCDPDADGARLRPRMGLMLQSGGLYPLMRVGEALRLFASFFRRPADPEELLAAVGLAGVRGSRIKQLSGGERQRLSLALALVGRPEVCFLDEPTAGMDPRARRLTWDFISRLQGEGTTIVLTTHFMEEADRLADRVAILHEGRVVACDTPAALKGAGAGETLRVEVATAFDPAPLAMLAAVRAVTPTGPGSCVLRVEDPPAALAAVAAWLRDQGLRARRLEVGGGSLEDVFLQLTGGADGAADTAPAAEGGR